MATFLNDSPVFGPVKSRRLGVSLGVNLMPATGKICTFDCLYCENGLNAQRRTPDGYNDAQTVLDALEARLRKMAGEGVLPDVITFAGNGEPTASPAFPEAIRGAVRLRDELAPRPRSPSSQTARARACPRSTTPSCLSMTTSSSLTPSTPTTSHFSTAPWAPTT